MASSIIGRGIFVVVGSLLMTVVTYWIVESLANAKIASSPTGYMIMAAVISTIWSILIGTLMFRKHMRSMKGAAGVLGLSVVSGLIALALMWLLVIWMLSNMTLVSV